MSYHNGRLRHQFDESPLLKRLVMRRFMRRCDAAIFTTEDALEQGIEIGHATERCHVVSSFIPPREEASRIDSLPYSVQKFMQEHSPNLSAGGWTIAFHEGIDIYGFDLLVELVGHMHRRWPKIGMTIALPQHTKGGYLHTLQNRAAALNVLDAILWVTEPLPEATPLWRASDVFIRPTCTDGDSLSLREALALGVPSVASDAAVRPVGCHLFRNRDLGALVAVVEDLLMSIRDTPRSRSDPASVPSDGIDAFVNLYSSLATDVSAHDL